MDDLKLMSRQKYKIKVCEFFLVVAIRDSWRLPKVRILDFLKNVYSYKIFCFWDLLSGFSL